MAIIPDKTKYDDSDDEYFEQDKDGRIPFELTDEERDAIAADPKVLNISCDKNGFFCTYFGKKNEIIEQEERFDSPEDALSALKRSR